MITMLFVIWILVQMNAPTWLIVSATFLFCCQVVCVVIKGMVKCLREDD